MVEESSGLLQLVQKCSCLNQIVNSLTFDLMYLWLPDLCTLYHNERAGKTKSPHVRMDTLYSISLSDFILDSAAYFKKVYCCVVVSGPRPELHLVPAHGGAQPAQTQPPAQGSAALRQADGVAEEHAEGEVRGLVHGQSAQEIPPR